MVLGKILCALAKALGGCLPTTPILKPAGTIDINEMSSILLDKLEEMGDNKAELYLPDMNCKIYNKREVQDFLHLDWTSQITYIKETLDCDDFAAEVYGKGLGLCWTNKHALSWFIDENRTLWFVEPQTNKVAKNLENWQGWEVRFFLGR